MKMEWFMKNQRLGEGKKKLKENIAGKKLCEVIRVEIKNCFFFIEMF